MAQKIAKVGVKRDADFMYYNIKDGDVWRIPRKVPGRPSGGSAERVARVGVGIDPSYVYFLDKNGDIARSKRPRNERSGANSRPKKSASAADPSRGPRGRRATTGLKSTATVTRRSTAAATVDPQHNKLQNRLCKLLRGKYGAAAVALEEDNVDLRVTTRTKTIYVEVKTSRVALLALRQALGQLLEYVYFSANRDRKVELWVAAPGAPTDKDRRYLKWLSARFKLTIKYAQVTQRMAADALPI